MPTGQAAPTPGELVANLTQELGGLARQEIQLAKAELSDEARGAALGGGLLGTTLVLAVIATTMLLIAAGLGLVAVGLSPGVAFLVVAGGCLLIAGGIGTLGLLAVSRVQGARRTKRTLSDTFSWLRHPRTAPDPELEALRARHQ
jgi:Putative Actinobacterial Holin-X, holin superfamily III